MFSYSHFCLQGFSIELHHQLWVLCIAESGHLVHLTYDLPTDSRGEAVSLRKARPFFLGPTQASQSHIPKDAFPIMNQTHHSVLPLVYSQGSGRSHEWGPARYSWQTWPLVRTTVRPFSAGQGKYGEGQKLGEKGLVPLRRQKHFVLVSLKTFSFSNVVMTQFSDIRYTLTLTLKMHHRGSILMRNCKKQWWRQTMLKRHFVHEVTYIQYLQLNMTTESFS